MLYVKYNTRGTAKMPIKHKVKPSTLFYIQQELGHALTVLKDLPINALKNSPTSIYTPLSTSTSPCKVRQHRTTFYANVSVSRQMSNVILLCYALHTGTLHTGTLHTGTLHTGTLHTGTFHFSYRLTKVVEAHSII